MSNPGEANDLPIENAVHLVDVLARGGKPSSDWRIGTEHEKFGFVRPAQTSDHVPYASPAYRPHGIEALLEAFHGDGDDWQEIRDQGNLIGLKGVAAEAGCSLSLEPAGQFELSGAPLADLHQTRTEMDAHFESTRRLAEPLGLGFAPIGFQPLWPREQMPWMPKSRYTIMRNYMPKVGSLGLDMMTRTCTVQVNLDFSDEADMVRKMQVGLALQPLATAFFANSPFANGRPTGLLSNRANVWTDTDNTRSGMPDCVFQPGFGFEAYVNWALDVPMYFIVREGRILDVAGASFRDWLAGRGAGVLADYRPTIGDFEDHLTTLFPDVRLKQFLEMRGADAGAPELMLAQSAFWVGLLYDSSALDAAWALVTEEPWESYRALRAIVPQRAMNAPFASGGLRALGQRVLAIAEYGLKQRGLGEEQYLAPLQTIAEGGPTQAEYWLERYQHVWAGDVRRIFDEAAI